MKTLNKHLKPIISLVLTIAILVTCCIVYVTASNEQVRLTVDTDTVIQDDYLGVGGNFWTGCMTEQGIEFLDMSQAYFDLNVKRIQTVKPAFMRIMVMPQYMVDFDDNHDGVVDDNDTDKGEQNWKNGKYDFESLAMKNFFAYCQAFKDAGTEILLNFGGACSEEIMDWFGIKDAPDMFYGTRSAPDDLEAFAKATSALLGECLNRGFDNVKYLNLYNESCHVNYGAFGDKRVYWCSMLKLIHNQLVSDGLRDKIVLIGADADTQFDYGYDTEHSEWLDYINRNASDYFDTFSVHTYFGWDLTQSRQLCSVDDIKDYCNEITAMYPDTMLTEFSYKKNNVFNYSRAGQLLAHANTGISASAIWFFMGTYIPNPLNTYIKDAHNLWSSPSKEGVDDVKTTFGEIGLFMKYIENHSQIVKSTSSTENVRVATYTKGDDMTVILEANESSKDRDIMVEFDKSYGKSFKKHVYIYPRDVEVDPNFDGNAILPISVGNYSLADNKLTDTIGSEHCLIVYTTYDDAEQLVLDKVEGTAKVNGSVQFNVTDVIGIQNKNVKWEILSGKGTVDSTGKYTATNTRVGDVVSIKVTSTVSDDGTYAIAIVKVTE